MTKFRFYLSVGVLLLWSASVVASKPASITYTSKDYKGHQTNYDAIFSGDGLIYVANAYGVIEFDGNQWNKTSLTSSRCPFSVYKAINGRVYVGGDNEIGYIEKNSKGLSVYHSLKSLLPDSNAKVGDWIPYCTEYKNKIYFADLYSIYIYDGKTIKVVKPSTKEGKFLFLRESKGELIVMEWGKGIGIMEDSKISFLPGNLAELEIKGVQKIAHQVYTFYGRDGIYNYNNGTLTKAPFSEFFASDLIKDVAFFGTQKIIGTEQNGCYVLDENFQIVQHFTPTNSSLLSSYIYCVSVNPQGDIMLATDNGLTIINTSTTSFKLNDINGLKGSGYSSFLTENGLYAGTSQGLFFAANWKPGGDYSFVKIAGVKPFLYSIFKIGKDLFCGDHSDVYQISGTNARVISQKSWKGAWFFSKVPGRSDLFLVGTFEGIDVYKNVNGSWQFSNSIKGYNFSARLFEFDSNGNIWVNSETSGLYMLKINTDFTAVESKVEWCSKLNVAPDYFKDIIKDDEVIKISSEGGIYLVSVDKVVKDPAFEGLPFKFDRIRKIKDGLLYTVKEGEPVVLRKVKDRFVIDSTNILNNTSFEMVGLVESIREFANNSYIVGTADGFTICDNTSERKYYNTTSIRSIKDLDSETLHDFMNVSELKIPYSGNSIAFTFASTALEKFYPATWYVKLSTSDEEGEWRKVDNANYKEYSNLPEGDYTFSAKALYRFKVLGESTVSFTILPPWYRTLLAKIIYLLLFVAAILMGRMLWKSRLKKVTDRLLAEKKKAMELQESQFREEQLKMQLQEKEMDLSFVALNFAQRKELLQTVGVKLKAIMSHSDIPPSLMKDLKAVEYSLRSSKEDEEPWDNFQVHFNTEYNDFITKLQQLDPKIKESMILMCTYLRMGKNNKEIAQLLNISLSALDKRKLRIKEKFSVPEDVTLNEFLRQL